MLCAMYKITKQALMTSIFSQDGTWKDLCNLILQWKSSEGSGLTTQDDIVSIHKAWRVSEWLDEYVNDVNHTD